MLCRWTLAPARFLVRLRSIACRLAAVGAGDPGLPGGLFEPLERRELLSGDLAVTVDQALAATDTPAPTASECPWFTTDDLATMPDTLRDDTGLGLGYAGASITYSTLANGMPILSSLPGAAAAIFLDFDGDPTYPSTLAYDTDGNSAVFGASEQADIAECWRQMSIYYAMFDVNVTTIQPDVATMPTAWEAIGNNISGGYSYIGVFPNTQAESWNSSGDARTRVSGIAHEIGHNFGLNHTSSYDLLGNKTTEYAGAVDPLHGPIMGTDYSGVIHKFTWLHPTSSPSTLQDDIGKIAGTIKSRAATGYTGDGFRPDDYGGTIAAATPLAVDDNLQTITGIIERPTDLDAFSFSVTGGRYLVSAERDNPSGVDLTLSIYDSSGLLLAAADGNPLAQPLTMVNDQQISLSLADGVYYAVVGSHGNYDDLGQYNVNVTPLPDGWTAQDVGLVGIPGSTSYDSATATFTMAASGADIWGSSDNLQYAYQTLQDDGTIIARVASMGGTDGWAKTGLMIRDNLAENSKEVAMLASWTGGIQMTWRTSTGGSTTGYNPTPAAFAPVWLKLTRSGNTFTGYTSTDGTDWTLWSTATVSMNATVYIGLAVSSHNQSKVNTSTFDNVSLTGTLNPQPVLNSLPAPTGLVVTASTASAISLSWDNQADQTGYTIERSSDGATYVQVGSTATDVTTYTDTGLSGWQRYFYRVRAKDASGVSATSSVVSGITRSAAVTGLTVTSWSDTKLILNWTDSSGETGYRVERSLDGTTGWTTRSTPAKNATSYTNTGLTLGTRYYYRIVTLDASGDAATTAAASGMTRMPAVTGLAFTSKASNQMVIQWTDLADETSYRIERSADGTTFASLGTVGVNVTTYTDSTVTPLTECYYRVIAVNSLTESLMPTPIFAAVPAAVALPAPWLSQDIGAVGGSGAAGYASGTYTVIASGSDVWGTSDQFRFLYRPLTGNSWIIAHVAVEENTDSWAKAGVMIRDTLGANSKQAFVEITPSYGAHFQYRAAAGGVSTDVSSSVTSPAWVRLTRSGNSFTAEASANGTTWTTISTVTITMGSSVYMGLALTSHSNTLLNTTQFDNVTWGNLPPIVANPMPDLAVAVNAAPTVLNLAGVFTDPDIATRGDSLTYSVTANTNATLVTTSISTPQLTLSYAAGRTGAATITVRATDTSGLWIEDSFNVTVAPPPAVTGITLNGQAGRGPSAVDPSGIGVRTIAVTFSEAMTFTEAAVTVQSVTFSGNTVVPGDVLTPVVTGSGTSTMTLSLAGTWVVDTWVQVTLKGDGSLVSQAYSISLDGEPNAGGSGRGYLWSAADLPTGDGLPGGDAIFFVGSLRGDLTGDGAVGPADKAAFMTAWNAGSLDADFRGVGFGVRPPDGQITLGDIDGFTSVYLAAVAAGRYLDPLPTSSAGWGASQAPAPLASGGVDILAQAAGQVLPLQQAIAPLLQPAASEQGDAAATDPLCVRPAQPLASSDASAEAVLRI